MNNDQSKIEQLKKKLYSISDTPPELHRSRLQHHASQVATNWGEEEVMDTLPKVPIKDTYTNNRRTSWLKRLLIVSIGLFVAAGIFAWYMIINDENNVSANNINVSIIGPVATPAGEKFSLDIEVKNLNPEKLEGVDMIVDYPTGTRKADDGATTILSERFPLGEIDKGQIARRQIQVILFGEENIKKDIRVTIEYKVPGSIIIFKKENIYPVFIGSAPIAVDISNLKEIIPGQSTTFHIAITSNSKEDIHSLLFKANYPAGFKFESASPAPTFENNTWTLGDIGPGDQREINVTGQILGDPNIERFFNFTAGTEDPLDNSSIAIPLVVTKEKIIVQQPFLATDISLNGKGDLMYVAPAGQQMRGRIVWQNNLSVPVYDLVLEVKLSGPTLDKKMVTVDRGFYTSLNNTIVWDKSRIPELAEVLPGVNGSFEFTIASLEPSVVNNTNLRRQTIGLNLTAKAKRLSEAQVPEEIKSTTEREVRIESQIGAVSQAVYSVGPFENTGPMPPRADKATTYTIMHSISNSFNNVKDVTYKATLPSYVNWLGKVYPESAISNVKYNEDTREITWLLGDAAPGLGFNSSPREFAYQVSVTPSISQLGQDPIIISKQKISGLDTFTNTVIETIEQALTTDIQSDPGFQFGWEKVGE